MADRRILLVGYLGGDALEVLETATILGYTPISVFFDPPKTEPDVEAWFIEELPSPYRKLTAIISGMRVYDDLRGRRLDEKWFLRLARSVRDAEVHGITNWTNLVHPTASVSPSAKVGRGVFVGPLVSISSGAEIAEFSRVGRNATVGHHATVGSFCHVGPGVVIPRGVIVGNGVTIGPAAVFLNAVTVGDRSLIGAGSVVTKSVKAGKQAQGNPARTYRSPKTVVIKTSIRMAKSTLRKLGLFDAVKKLFRKG